jgi:hypothetical protein
VSRIGGLWAYKGGSAAVVISDSREITQMAEAITQTQVLAAKRWMADEAGMERASLSPAEYLVYRMKVSDAEAEALVEAVYALEERE